MPNQPKTPGHTIRVPDDEWVPARDKAAENGETMTDVIRRALRRYVTGALLGVLVLASFSGSAQASAPEVTVAAQMSATATFVATVRQIGAGTVIDDLTDADLILMGSGVCANIAAGQTGAAYWQMVTSAYSAKAAEGVGVSSYARWMSIYIAWRQASITAFCPGQYL